MNALFPATYSTLCPTALSSLISEKYEAENVQCKLLVRGVNTSSLIIIGFQGIVISEV